MPASGHSAAALAPADGSQVAAFSLGEAYKEGEGGVEVDLVEARRCYTIARDGGHQGAATALARLNDLEANAE